MNAPANPAKALQSAKRTHEGTENDAICGISRRIPFFENESAATPFGERLVRASLGFFEFFTH